MKKHIQKRFIALAFTIGLLSILNLQPSTAHAQNTAFLYQVQVDQGLPTDLAQGKHKIGDGTDTFRFLLATAATGSNYIGTAITNKVIVASLQFSTTLDFSNVFDGSPRWLEIARKVGKQFITLTPRQLLPSTPYAQYASTAGAIAASNISGGYIAINAGSGLSGGGTVALGGSTTISNTGVLSVTGSGSIIASTVDGAVTLSAGTIAASNISGGSIAINAGSGLSGGGTVALGGSTTISNTGVLSVTGSGSIIASTVGGAVTLSAGAIAASNISGGSITLTAGSGLSGGGTVALGGSTTISNTGVISVTGDGNIIASTVDGAVTLSENATNGNSANTLVERDGSGNFSANGIALNSLNLPDPAIVYSGGNALLYSDGGTGNFSAGLAAGNSIGSGTDNTASGYQALYTNGSVNSSGTFLHHAVGAGNNNTANGYQALYNNGNVNISGGANEQQSVTVGNNNTANGNQALYNNGNVNISGANIQQPVSAGNDNTAYGFQALYNNGGVNLGGGNIQASVTVGNNNTAYGYQALYNIASVNDSGGGVYSSLNNGNNNIALGYQAGNNIIAGNNNIDIGASGTNDESGTIRIGDPSVQTATYLAGTVYANGVELTSDRNAKEQFAPVNAQAVLDKVAALPITQWQFKTDKSVQHIGPMAQDFKAAFNVGTDDKHIAVVDEGGVALAAIQGLNQKLNEQSAQMKAKDAELQDLKQSVAELKNMIETLSRQPQTGGAR